MSHLECDYKQRFASPQAAMRTASDRVGLRPYLCPHCHQYHLTSRAHLPAKRIAEMDSRRARR